MRAIKFRVYDEDSNQYLDGDFSLGIISGEIRGKYGEVFNNLKIEQFTGLTDKNGKEIYEGDVLKTSSESFCYVVFADTGFAVKSEGSEAIDWEFSTFYKECEIIGNIHENNFAY